VILRVVAGVTGGAEPRLERGLIRAHVGVDRTSGETVEVTVWDDAEAARSADGHGADASYFDVGTTWLEWSREEPVAFRLAVGRFSKPGADQEMLAALRERVALIADDVTESAVGRRLADRAVEVVFFTAWARETDQLRLDRPFWPDMSLRYDDFEVRVCNPTRPVVSRPPVP
jgi:hypothetical protein